jgi:hypothetical protein
MPRLEETQQAFFGALQMPLRGTSRDSTELPANDEGHSEEFLTTAEALLKDGTNLSAAERLELYHRQYWFRLLDSIAEDFPVLQKMAGDEFFWEMMEAYIERCPSGSFTLRHFGRRMVEFLHGWERLDERQRLWFPAIAEIEYAAMEIFEAAEREPLPPEQLGTAVLELQPHVRLMALPVAADDCADEVDLSAIEPVWLAVWRGPNGGADQARLEEVEYELLRRMQAGGMLHELFAEPVEPEPTAEQVQEWFAKWQERGWITARNSAEVIDLFKHRDGDWDGVDKMGSQARAMED